MILSSKKQLFLDDHVIAAANNVRRVIHPARKHPSNPVLWDGHVYGSVIQDAGKYRMWYQCGRAVCYAESEDGIRWKKPALDVCRIEGRNTNVLLARRETAQQAGRVACSEPGPLFPYFYELFGVHKDLRDNDPARRYKMGYLSDDRSYSGPHEDPFHKGQRRGLGVAASPDGIHWQVVKDWATDAICDGGTHWMFDEGRGKYILYGRTKYIPPEVARAWGLNGLPTVPMSPEWHAFVKETVWGRAVARAESADFLQWDVTQGGKAPVVMADDAQDRPGTEIYALHVFPYESLFIGLVKVWHRTPDGGPLDIELAVSHDSVNFTRVGDRTAFIPVGDAGEWDRFNQSVSTNPPIAVGDELRFYYSGRTARHSPYRGKDTGAIGSGVGIATIPRDRFVSLAASFDGGQILTKLLRLSGPRLHLNAKSDFGEILIEVLDQAGQMVRRSKPVRTDSLDITVDWEQSSTSGFEGPVVLRITLKNAHLFAIWSS